jgi:peptide deformylase
MKILIAPHPTLRSVAAAVEHVDKKLTSLITDLGTTLKKKDDPPGVGLAAPQVQVLKRFFATYLPITEAEDSPQFLRVIINPVVTDMSDTVVFGPKKDEQRLEGCLSIPDIYGPVPRWKWIEYEFLELENSVLVPKKERFADFPARVMQHEFDHLEGILFTDYSLKHDLPIFKENKKTKELEKVDKAIIELL